VTPQIQAERSPASATFAQLCVLPCEPPLSEPVGQDRLSDDEREEAIRRAGRALEAHYFTWCCTGDFAAKADADRAQMLMTALIRGRSKDAVLRLEIKRGLI
jgi:hypothetical protein